MSADNFIAIQKRKGKWYVWMDWASCPKKKPNGYYMRIFKKHKKALRYAAELCNNEVVEYGIQILSPMD